MDTTLPAPSKIALVDVLEPGNGDDREHIGLASIAAVLRRQGLSVDLMSFVVGEDGPAAFPLAYELYGFSIYPQTAAEISRYADAIKARHPAALVCVGGQLATAASGEILADCPSIDFCVLGDGETPVANVVAALRAGAALTGIPSIATRTAGSSAIARTNVAELSWPVRDLLARSIASGNLTARLNASLGCAASCTFCSVNGFLDAEAEMSRAGDASGVWRTLAPVPARSPVSNEPPVRKRWRARSVEDVFKEILWLRDRYRIRSFVFNDASFEDPGAIGKRRIAELCALVRSTAEPLAFRCSVRAESFGADDAALLETMRRAGFTNIFVGIEAGNDGDLGVFNKIASLEDNERTIALFRGCDIDLTMGFIMLNPYSTEETLRENCRFLARHKAFVPNHYIGKVQVYYGTGLHRQLAQDHLLGDDFSYRNPYGYRFVLPGIGEVDRMLQELRDSPALNELSGRMYSLSYTMSTLRGLFGADAEAATSEFRAHRNRSAEILASYFEQLFEWGSIGTAVKLLPEFLAAIRDECRGLRSFRLRLLYNRAFRDYFLAPHVEVAIPAS